MPDNPNTNQPNTGSTIGSTPGKTGSTPGTTGTTGGSMGTPGGTPSYTGTTGAEGHGLHGTSGTPGGGTGTGTAPALAQQYGQKISEVATQAKDFVTDKVSVVGDKIKDLQNADIGELAENAKEYARRKPGQALLISAAVGLVLGLLVRGRR